MADEPDYSGSQLLGSLDLVPLEQVCLLVGASAMTGMLDLSFKGVGAQVYFKQGRVTAAEFAGQGNLAGRRLG